MVIKSPNLTITVPVISLKMIVLRCVLALKTLKIMCQNNVSDYKDKIGIYGDISTTMKFS